MRWLWAPPRWSSVQDGLHAGLGDRDSCEWFRPCLRHAAVLFARSSGPSSTCTCRLGSAGQGEQHGLISRMQSNTMSNWSTNVLQYAYEVFLVGGSPPGPLCCRLIGCAPPPCKELSSDSSCAGRRGFSDCHEAWYLGGGTFRATGTACYSTWYKYAPRQATYSTLESPRKGGPKPK